MGKKIWFVVLVLALIWVGIGFKEAVAQGKKVEDFYKGATIKFICPWAVGGGYDQWARALAPFLEKYTGARVLVENMTGAGGLLATAYIRDRAKPDGLTICIMAMPGMILSQMLEIEGTKVDIEQFSLIGRLEVAERAVLAGKVSGFKSITDMQKSPRPIHFISTDPTSDASVDAALISEGFGLNAKIITGSKGTSQSVLYVVSGRGADAVCATFAQWQDYVKKGDINVLLFWKRNPDYPSVPVALEAPGIKPGGRKYIELLTQLPEAGRGILTSLKVPEERLLFLEKALSASLREPGLVNWTKKMEYNINPLLGKEYKDLIVKMLRIVPQSERAELKAIVFEKYY